jgi:hypothetical protein
MTTLYRVTRPVAADEPHNFSNCAWEPGELLEEFDGCTYGSIDWDGGVALTTVNGDSYFEFPADAVERVA